jgi:hypothetical protein
MIEIDKTRLFEENLTGSPGEIVYNQGDELIVIAKNRGLVIEQISVDGKSIDPSQILKPGDVLSKKDLEEGKK